MSSTHGVARLSRPNIPGLGELFVKPAHWLVAARAIIIAAYFIGSHAFAQTFHASDSIVVHGTVTDLSGNFIAQATIEADDGQSVSTRPDGSFRLWLSRDRAAKVRVRAVGYQPDSVSLSQQGFHAAEITLVFRLARIVVVLDPVRMVAPRILDRVGFYDRRMRVAGGRFLDDSAIKKIGSRHVTELLGQVAGVRILYTRQPIPGAENFDLQPGFVVTLTRGARSLDGKPCAVKFILDGIPFEPGARGVDDDVSMNDLVGVEVYSSATVPTQFSRLGSSCGVILLWTRAIGL